MRLFSLNHYAVKMKSYDWYGKREFSKIKMREIYLLGD